ncbi:uncharacterized protein LOC107648526 [Arachis ipaensis]|uniref:uncharacterized protein LOC107648526 n=1 Tax=Arachis ipaensis TaxID=130454 RepID=UPI000A2B5D95|nr:uncharacterized protein LOC107648526 [Arachis ipaensis]
MVSIDRTGAISLSDIRDGVSLDSNAKSIAVEILNENERPNLHGAIQNYTVHGPCGPYNKNSPCMKNGSYSKFYPKEFRQRILIDEAGFSKYRRIDNGRTVKKRKCVLDNKFIVSYNLELLLKFGCHINVEYTCQTSSIKYLFKYVHKGNDRVTTTLYNAGDPSEATQVVDEIRNYYDCRYISACEAVWRLFGYEIQEKEPFVIILPFHLVDEQPMVYGKISNVNDIVERAISHKSMFLGWMAANMSYPYTRSLTYAEFPTKFVWKDDSSKWFPRKKGFAIERLMYIQRGCMSFRDIRTVGGTIYAMYRDACFALGLLQDDKEFIDVIKEASSWASGSYVRRLFVILLKSNNISRPEHVWDRCWHELLDDILYRQRAVMNMRELTMSDDEIKQLCLMNIDKILHSYGKTLKNYPPMPLATKVDSSLLTERVIREELNFNRDDLKCLRHVLKLTKNMRLSVRTTASDQDETEQFGEWLLKVSDGLIGDNMDGEYEICLPGDIVIPSSDQTFDELVHFSYPNILENMSSKDFFKARTILAPTLDIVKEVNNHLMAIIPGGKNYILVRIPFVWMKGIWRVS